MPVGAFGGKADIMSHVAPEGPVYQAGTLSANPIALSAGMASIELLLYDGFYDKLEEKTQQFVSQILDHTKSKGYTFNIQQIGSIFWLAFADSRITRADQIDPSSMDLFRQLHKRLLERGVYLGPSGYEVGFVSSAHSSESLDFAAKQICEVLDEILN